MRRKCHTCLCRTCLNICGECIKCKGKVELCEDHIGFMQLSIFEMPLYQKYQSAPRHSWQYYGITKERYKNLTEHIRSGKYASLASYAAHKANEMIGEYILLSVTQNKSYDSLRVKWELKEMEQIPYGRTDFYGIRRYFIHLMDLEMRKIGK